jgi:hypothetical protein
MGFTILMPDWDAAAGERLKEIAADLRGAGVIDMFEKTVARVWQVNVDRFEPGEVGDTNRSLGITASENIRTLVLRESWSGDNPRLGGGVHVTAPNDSLLVQVAGVRLHVMKSAPALTLSEPRWDSEFIWKGESDVRLEAATANASVYHRFLTVPGGLFEHMDPPADRTSGLREVMLVWAGGSNSPATGGWLGLPITGERPWLAVRNVWWHGPAGHEAGSRDRDQPANDTFTDRKAPSPVIAIRQRPRTAEQ